MQASTKTTLCDARSILSALSLDLTNRRLQLIMHFVSAPRSRGTSDRCCSRLERSFDKELEQQRRLTHRKQGHSCIHRGHQSHIITRCTSSRQGSICKKRSVQGSLLKRLFLGPASSKNPTHAPQCSSVTVISLLKENAWLVD